MTPLLLGGIVEAVGKVADQLFTSDKERLDAEIELRKIGVQEQQIEASLITGQLEINKAEAANSNLFVSGWRPAAGWVCDVGLAYEFLFRPILGWLAQNILGWTVPPALDLGTLLTLLFGLLGLGGLRSFEKYKGVSK